MADIKLSNLTNVTPTNVSTGDLFVNNDNGTTLVWNGSNWESIGEKQEKRLDKIEKMLKKIADRLAILDDPDPKRLGEFKTLQEAYSKYKFVDGLCGKNNEKGD